MSLIDLGIQTFVDPATGRAVSSGFVYIGIVDLDPTVVANQQEVRLRQEDGTEIIGAQPVSLRCWRSTYLQWISCTTCYVLVEYSIAVHDSVGAQVYYMPSGAQILEMAFPATTGKTGRILETDGTDFFWG